MNSEETEPTMDNQSSNFKNMNRRTALKTIGGTAMASLAMTTMAAARSERHFDLMMTPQQSGVYNAYAVMQTRAKDNHDWLRPQLIESGGFNYNVSYMNRFEKKWNNTAFGSATVLEWAASAGVKPFYKEPAKAVADFRIIGGMGATGNFWVTFDPNIKTPADFTGKRVSTGLLTQNEWGMYQKMLLDQWGITDKLDSLTALGPAKNVDALIDGKVDVASMVSFFTPDMETVIPAGPFNKILASNRPFYYVHVPEGMILDYNKQTGGNFEVRNFKPNSLANQPEPFTTFGDFMTVSAHKDFDEELAYEFTKLWVKMGSTVAKYNALGKVWTPDGIADPARNNPARTHPGSLRAFKEMKLI